MLAFTNTEMTKAEFMANLRAHAAADEIIQGTGYNNGRGCAVGCSMNTYDHSLYPDRIGVPEHLAHLEEAIFEGLPVEEAHKFPLQFGEAINEGADLSKVYWQFSVWMLTDPEHGVKRFSGNADWGVADAIDKVAGLCARMAVGEAASHDDWKAAESAAWSAARSAAWSAAWGAAWSAARSAAAGSAWSAARSAAAGSYCNAAGAAESAAGSVAAGAAGNAAVNVARIVARNARIAAHIVMRDKLLELLAAAPVVQS